MLNNINKDQQVNMMQQISQKRIEEQQKIATGKQINSASDNAAGLAISEALWNEINGLEAATRNTQDGISMIATAEGGMGAMQDGLQRVRELTLQAGNGTYGESERNIIGNEIKQILGGMNDIVSNTEFNGKVLLNGAFDEASGGLNLQTGAGSGDLTNASISNMSLDSLGLSGIESLDFGSMNVDDLGALLETVDGALSQVSESRSEIGAMQNGLESIISSNSNTSVNLQSSVSKITDTDMAKAMMESTASQVLSDVNISLQVHEMQDSQVALKLLLE